MIAFAVTTGVMLLLVLAAAGWMLTRLFRTLRAGGDDSIQRLPTLATDVKHEFQRVTGRRPRQLNTDFFVTIDGKTRRKTPEPP